MLIVCKLVEEIDLKCVISDGFKCKEYKLYFMVLKYVIGVKYVVYNWLR